VLAQGGRVGALLPARVAQAEGQRGQDADLAVREARLEEAAAGRELRVVEQVLGPRDRREGQVGALAQVHDLGERHAAEHAPQLGQQPVALGDAVVVRRQARVREQVVAAELAAEALPLLVRRHAHEHELVVGRAELVVDRPGAHPLRHRRHLLARGHRVGHVVAHDERRRLEQRAPHDLPAAGALALPQREHHAHRAVDARHHVDDRGAGAQRLPARAGHVGQARHHLHDLVEGDAPLVGPRQEALQGAVDEPRVAGGELVGAEAQAVHRAGGEVLHEDVGGLEEPVRGVEAPGVLHVQHHALLVAVEERVVAHAEAAQVAGRVALRRGLDAHDLGAQVGEHQAAGRAQHRLGELDHAHARQRRLGGPRGGAGRPVGRALVLRVAGRRTPHLFTE